MSVPIVEVGFALRLDCSDTRELFNATLISYQQHVSLRGDVVFIILMDGRTTKGLYRLILVCVYSKYVAPVAGNVYINFGYCTSFRVKTPRAAETKGHTEGKTGKTAMPAIKTDAYFTTYLALLFLLTYSYFPL